MNYIKEYKLYSKEIDAEALCDIFIDLEDEGYTIKSRNSQIVKGRNDWGHSEMRNVYGGKFILNEDSAELSKADTPLDAIIIAVSKPGYIKELTEESIVTHWEKSDASLVKKIEVIKNRVKSLGVNLYGVTAQWYQLGKASHSDFSNEPYFGYDMLIDCYIFAFL